MEPCRHSVKGWCERCMREDVIRRSIESGRKARLERERALNVHRNIIKKEDAEKFNIKKVKISVAPKCPVESINISFDVNPQLRYYDGHNDEWSPVKYFDKKENSLFNIRQKVNHWEKFGTCPRCQDGTKPECMGGIFICPKCDWRN